MLSVGMNVKMEYSLNNGKIRITRSVKIVGEDDYCYYVNTGYLKNSPVFKKDIVNISLLD